MSGFLAWRYTSQGAVAHAVWTDGTNRANGAALCGLASDRWYYGKSIGWSERCRRCRAAAPLAEPPEPPA